MEHRTVFYRAFVFSLLLLVAAVAQAGNPQRGHQIYLERCAGCHGVTGFPTMSAVPAFGRGEGMMKPDDELVAFVKRGMAVMPGYEGILTDQEIRDTLAYIRTLF